MADSGTPRRHTVLVVDDDGASRDIVRRTLQDEHRVLLAEDAAGAFEALESEPVDLLLLDVMLPDVPGFEICRKVKSRPRDGYLPVMLLTALDEQTDRNAGLAAGADDYLTKPFDRSELRLRVRTFLSLRDRERAQRSTIDESKRVQELKDDLVALIAHDLRNPLMGIQGNLDLLRALTASPEHGVLSARVDRAITSTEELRAILEGLLDVHRLEESSLPAHREPTAVRELLQESIASLEGAARGRAIELRVEIPDGFQASVDRGLLRRAVENLLSNALRHGPHGSAVTVGARLTDGMLRVEVGDRGPGVPDELKQELFQKFGASSGARNCRKGYGLGLYLVRLVAEAHGGTASVVDRPGGGALFALTLSP